MNPTPQAAIISSGTEILQGLYPDTNAQYLSGRLLTLGIPVCAHMAVGDDRADIRRALEQSAAIANLVIITGGLGPTADDYNRFVVSELYNRPLQSDERVLAMIKERFARRGLRPRGNNEVQAMIPKGATVFYNEWGTAAGFALDADPQRGLPLLIALPGPPRELQPMFETSVEAFLASKFTGNFFILVRRIHTIERSESELGALTADLHGANPRIHFAWLASEGKVDFRVTARAALREEALRDLDEVEKEVRRRVGERSIYGTDDETLESAVAKLLIPRGATVTVAESCTAGLLSHRLTNVSGSSAYFKQGFLTYSNEAKTELLDVSTELLERFGAVSEEVARAMAQGARRRTGSDYALAVTGISGPTGGTPEKPVGLTYIAVDCDSGTHAKHYRFLGNRSENRLYATHAALNLLRLALIEK